MRALILIVLALFIALSLHSQTAEGKWYGEVGGSKNKIQFVFHLSEDNGEWTAIVDIPSQNLKGLKTRKTEFTRDSLYIDGKNLGFEYSAKLEKSVEQFLGVFKEGVNQVALNLSREKPDIVRKVRPQEPVKPYPYREEEVVFKNRKDNITLAGTLTLPEYNGKQFPTVILITGSGPQNRDEEIFGHKPFLVLADHLTRLGIAILRFDDRGVNESTGNFTEATTADFATDVESAISYLKTRSEVDKERIGLVGHSEGGIIAPMVAAKSKDVSFIVLLAGTGVSGFETVLRQSIDMRGFPVADEEAFKEFMTNVLKIASADKELSLVRKELTSYYDKSAFFNAAVGETEQRTQILKDLVEARTSKWVRYFYNYNPADMIEIVECPVLSINGTKDIQVNAEVNQAGIKAALERGGNRDFQVIALEGLNHFFQEAETGDMKEYATIEQTFSPKAMKIISDWILKRVK